MEDQHDPSEGSRRSDAGRTRDEEDFPTAEGAGESPPKGPMDVVSESLLANRDIWKAPARSTDISLPTAPGSDFEGHPKAVDSAAVRGSALLAQAPNLPSLADSSDSPATDPTWPNPVVVDQSPIVVAPVSGPSRRGWEVGPAIDRPIPQQTTSPVGPLPEVDRPSIRPEIQDPESPRVAPPAEAFRADSLPTSPVRIAPDRPSDRGPSEPVGPWGVASEAAGSIDQGSSLPTMVPDDPTDSESSVRAGRGEVGPSPTISGIEPGSTGPLAIWGDRARSTPRASTAPSLVRNPLSSELRNFSMASPVTSEGSEGSSSLPEFGRGREEEGFGGASARGVESADLSKTNELLQQLLDAVRSQRDSALPVGGPAVYSCR